MITKELEFYTDGVLAERERISDMLEDLLTELQLEAEQALKNKLWSDVEKLMYKIKILEDINKMIRVDLS